jgi:DNA-directed RNA polymerase beta subunit
MAETKTTSRERTNFSKIRTAIQIPNLIEVQKKSYERFLQMNMLPEEREDTGLQAVFNSVFRSRISVRVHSRVHQLLHRQLGMQMRKPEGPASSAQHL